MTETAFRVVVAGLYDRVATDPPITATDIKHGLLDLGFDGVTVTPMDDALIKAAEDLISIIKAGDYVRADDLEPLTAAIAKARGDTK